MSAHDSREFRALAAAIRQASNTAGNGSDACLDEFAIAAFAEGNCDPLERSRITAHLVTCADCRTQFSELCASMRDVAVTEATAMHARASRRVRLPGALVGLAAAAVLVIVVLGQRRIAGRDATTSLRDFRGVTGVAPVAIAPVAVSSDSVVFRWSRVPRADRYRVTVFSADGVVVWETQTSDTTAMPPSPSPLQHGVPYLWKIAARTDFDRWITSDLIPFSVPVTGVKR